MASGVKTTTHDGREVKPPKLTPPQFDYDPVNMKNPSVFWMVLVKMNRDRII